MYSIVYNFLGFNDFGILFKCFEINFGEENSLLVFYKGPLSEHGCDFA